MPASLAAARGVLSDHGFCRTRYLLPRPLPPNSLPCLRRADGHRRLRKAAPLTAGTLCCSSVPAASAVGHSLGASCRSAPIVARDRSNGTAPSWCGECSTLDAHAVKALMKATAARGGGHRLRRAAATSLGLAPAQAGTWSRRLVRRRTRSFRVGRLSRCTSAAVCRILREHEGCHRSRRHAAAVR